MKKHFLLYLLMGLAFPLFVSCNLVPIDEEDPVPVPAAVINFATTSTATSVNAQSLDIGLSVTGDITTATTINVSLTSPSGTVPSVSITTPSFVLSPGETVPTINLQLSRNGQEIYTEAAQFTLTLASESTANVVVGTSPVFTLTVSEDTLAYYSLSFVSNAGELELGIYEGSSDAQKIKSVEREKMCLDKKNNHIYYVTRADNTDPNQIRRCDLAGQNDQLIVELGIDIAISALGINTESNRVFVYNQDENNLSMQLQEVNFDGTGLRTLWTNQSDDIRAGQT